MNIFIFKNLKHISVPTAKFSVGPGLGSHKFQIRVPDLRDSDCGITGTLPDADP